MSDKAILFDTGRCTGCHGCQVACKCWNNLPSTWELNGNQFSGTHQNPPDINGWTRLIMTYEEREGGSKGVQWAFGRRACQHCTDAACVSVCPAAAVYVDEATGLVTTDDSKCIGCRYCSIACPYDVPRYDEATGFINKCTGCVDRIEQGMAPACVTTCQAEALLFGDRDEMLARAHESVERLQARGYADACVYGEEEMGGLHVIQVLKYGTEGDLHMPLSGTGEGNGWMDAAGVMKPVTGAAAGLTAAGLAAMFATAIGYKRDKVVYNAETEDTISLVTGDVVKHGDGQSDKTVMEHITENLGKKGSRAIEVDEDVEAGRE